MPNLIGRFRLLKSARNYDAVFLHKRRLNFFNAIILRKYAKHIIYDFDDAVMFDDKKPDKYSLKRQFSFARTVKLADIVLAGNPYLAGKARPYNSNVHILPTGLATNDYCCRLPERTDDLVRLVWIGSQSTIKYLEQLRPDLEEIGKQFDNVVLRIICDTFFDLENMPVEKVDWTLERQGRDLAESDIGLAPLPGDRFTRGKCGFKILQYASAGLPVVASGVGVNAEFVGKGHGGFLAEDGKWVEPLRRMIESRQLRSEMGLRNKEYVRQFDIDAIGSRLVELIKQLNFTA